MRSDTNSDMSDADDRYGVDVDEDNVSARRSTASLKTLKTFAAPTYNPHPTITRRILLTSWPK
jgi:hypothetical protein